jgi:hypothetical protein
MYREHNNKVIEQIKANRLANNPFINVFTKKTNKRVNTKDNTGYILHKKEFVL